VANYDSVDLDFTWDGDYFVGKDGDIADTSDDLIRSLENEIHTVLRSEFGDWERDIVVGANMSEFRGEPNTRETGKQVEDRIRSRLVAIGIVQGEDLNVRVIPVGPHKVMIVIHINVTATSGNRLEIGEPLAVSLTYDSLEDSVFFLEVDQAERNAR
jgi:Fe2+ transport system protein FeoA